MRSPFTTLPERVVVIRRDTGEKTDDGTPVTVDFEIKLRPYPLGYPERIGAAFPAPVVYVNGEETPDRTRAEDYASRRALILLARCIVEPALDAQEPSATAKPAAWHDYADSILRELEAAHLVPGDIQRLVREADLVSRGAGVLGKAASS